MCLCKRKNKHKPSNDPKNNHDHKDTRLHPSWSVSTTSTTISNSAQVSSSSSLPTSLTLWQSLVLFFYLAILVSFMIWIVNSIESDWSISGNGTGLLLLGGPVARIQCRQISPELNLVACGFRQWSFHTDPLQCTIIYPIAFWTTLISCMFIMMTMNIQCISRIRPHNNKLMRVITVCAGFLIITACNSTTLLWKFSCVHYWIQNDIVHPFVSVSSSLNTTVVAFVYMDLQVSSSMSIEQNATTSLQVAPLSYIQSDQFSTMITVSLTAAWWFMIVLPLLFGIWIIAQKPMCPHHCPTKLSRCTSDGGTSIVSSIRVSKV